MKIVLIDNYDSFTWMLHDLIMQCGVTCTIMRNDDEMLLKEVAVSDAIIISPGPCRPADAALLPRVISEFYKHKPMLGVCLGHQALGEFFGASLVKAKVPRHGKVDTITHSDDALFRNVPHIFKATRYHSLVLNDIPECLAVTAVSDQGENMAMRHHELPIRGVQFHPESCMTTHGLTMIKNFIGTVKSFA